MTKFRKCILLAFAAVMIAASCQQQLPPLPGILPGGDGNQDASSISRTEAIETAALAFNSLNQNAIQEDVVDALKHFMGDATVPNNPNISRVAGTTAITLDGTEYPVENKAGLESVLDALLQKIQGEILVILLSDSFFISLDESPISMKTSIEFESYADCFWETGSAESILDGQIDVSGAISEVILDKPFSAIVGNDNDINASILGRYEVSTATASPLQLMMNDENHSRYDLSFSGLSGVFKLTANIDANKIGLMQLYLYLQAQNYDAIIEMIADAVQSWDVVVYVPETSAEFSAVVADPSTSDSQTLSWSEISSSFDSKTNKIDADDFFAIFDAFAEFTGTLSNSAFGTVRFFNNLDTAIKSGDGSSAANGGFTISNIDDLAVSGDELRFEIALNGYEFSSESGTTASGNASLTFKGDGTPSAFTATEYEIDADITLSTGENGTFAASGSVASATEEVVFVLTSDSVSGVQYANGADQDKLSSVFDRIGIDSIEGVDLQVIF